MPLRLRLLLSALAGALLLGITVYASFQWYRGQAASVFQRGTLYRLRRTQEDVETYQKEQGALPRTLDDLSRGYVLSDRWERPLIYQVEGDRYRIVSYGLDGKPGGVGLDSDLSTDDLPKDGTSPRVPPQVLATFQQFLADWKHASLGPSLPSGSGGMMALMSGLTGLAAFMLSFLVLGKETSPPRGCASVAVRLVVTSLLTFYVGWCIACLHAPTGH